VDETPLPFRVHGVRVCLAEEAQAVCLQQLLGGRWKALKLTMEKGDGARILVAAEDKLRFALALRLLVNTRERYGERNNQQSPAMFGRLSKAESKD